MIISKEVYSFYLQNSTHISRDLFEGGEVLLVVVRAVVSTKDINSH